MGLDRRAFLTFLAGGVVGLGLTPIPYKITDDISIWTQNWSWTPTVPKRSAFFTQVASKMDPGGAGIRVVAYDGRPCQVVGNPDHPLSRGGLSAIAANEVQALHDPNRVKTPMVRRGEKLEPCTWSEAMSVLKDKAASAKDSLAVVSGDETGTASEVLAAFASKAGGKFFMAPGEAASAAKAMQMMGASGRLGYDLENSDYVLILGAEALESWGTSVRNARAFAAAHPTGGRPRAKYVYAGPVLGPTATVCDAYVQARPGSAGVLAMGLARCLVEAGAKAPARDFAEFSRIAAAEFSPARVESETGVSERALRQIARELAAARRPLVITGSEFNAGAGAKTVAAGLAVNLLLGNFNRPGGARAIAEAPTVVPGAPASQTMFGADLVAYLSSVAEGRETPALLMIYNANPAYALPRTAAMASAVKKAGFTVAMSTFMDETAAMADLVLPAAATLERYDDVYTPYGAGEAIYSLNAPVVKKPAYDCRHAGDVVLALADSLGLGLGFASMREVVEAKAQALGANLAALRKGAAWTASACAPQSGLSLVPAAADHVSAGKEGFRLALAPQARLALGSATVAPLLGMNAVSSAELAKGASVVQVNARTAAACGLRQNADVRLAGPEGEMSARVLISEKVMTGVVAAPLGLGRNAFGQPAGGNAHTLLSVADEPDSGLSVWTGSRVNVA
ncbi:MAG: menaquinone reductase molybdopterin-binding-like subunit QrcB [Thermodesulfobacteriota bacterium]